MTVFCSVACSLLLADFGQRGLGAICPSFILIKGHPTPCHRHDQLLAVVLLSVGIRAGLIQGNSSPPAAFRRSCFAGRAAARAGGRGSGCR